LADDNVVLTAGGAEAVQRFAAAGADLAEAVEGALRHGPDTWAKLDAIGLALAAYIAAVEADAS
jgi:hypothetical protein